MFKWNLLLAGACAAVMGIASTVPALAEAPQTFAGTLSGSYGNLSISGGGGDADIYGGDGQAAFGLGMPNLGAEVDAGYHYLSANGGSIDTYNIGGHAFWATMQGRLGATVQYQSLSGSGFSAHITNYGGFGEYYASDAITLGLNAGGYTASAFGSSDNDIYIGGGFSGYLTPNVAVTGLINYYNATGGNLTSYTGMLEWLVSESTPISLFGSYTNTQVSGGGGHLNLWMIGVKFYTDGNGTTLVGKHRNGALDNIVRPSIRILN